MSSKNRLYHSMLDKQTQHYGSTKWSGNQRWFVVEHINPLDYTFLTTPFDEQSGGGDACLAENYIKVMQGKESSATPLSDGLLSALMCLKAKESSENATFQSIHWEL